MFSRYFSSTLIKSILGFVTAAASFPPSCVIPEVGLGRSRSVPRAFEEERCPPSLSAGSCIFCVLALLSRWEFLFLDAAEPSCPSAFPTASLVPIVSFLKLSQGNVQG